MPSCLLAIIDIDGNNWSARFRTLLCTNSIVIKIQPDFVEQYYAELQPNVHYIPANLDNITHVVEYVIAEENDREMHYIVKNANKWCKKRQGKEALALNAIEALDQYSHALERYHGDSMWMEKEWHGSTILDGIDDLIECKV